MQGMRSFSSSLPGVKILFKVSAYAHISLLYFDDESVEFGFCCLTLVNLKVQKKA